MADGGIQMSEAFSHWVFVPWLSGGSTRASLHPAVTPNLRNTATNVFLFFPPKIRNKDQETAREELTFSP